MVRSERFTVVALVWLLALSLSVQAADDAALAVQNPGFGVDVDGDGVPDGWSFSWRATQSGDEKRGAERREPDWACDRDVKHTGAASIRCGVTRAQDDGVWTQDNIKIPEGTKYLKVTAWCRAQNVNNCAGTVAAVFLGEDGKWLDANYRAIAVQQTCDWTKYTGHVQVPAGAKTLRIRCWANFDRVGTGTFWFDDIVVEAVDRIPEVRTVYLDETSPPKPTAEEKTRGFFLFSRSYVRALFPNDVPNADERVDALSVSACRGEYEPAILVVRALRGLGDVRVSVTDLKGESGMIPSRSLDVRSVRIHPKEGQARWGPFDETVMDVPLFLEKRDSVSVGAESNQPFWITVHVPENAAPGTYRGSVTVAAAGSPGAKVPLTLDVHPFDLAEPNGITFAMYTKMRNDPKWLAETFSDMRAHGLTSIGLCGNSGLSIKRTNDEVVVEWSGESALECNLDEYVRAGFPEPVVWLMGADIPRYCEKTSPLDSPEFARAYRSVIQQIIDHGRSRGWPEIIFQPVDEPFEHADRLSRAKRLLEILKSIPGLRTENDGMNGHWENFDSDFYRLSDCLALHDGPTLHRGRLDMDEWWAYRAKAVADGKRIWFYNIDLTGWHPEPVRFMTGFGLWKSKAHGVLEWAYMFPVKESDPAAVYRQPKALLYRFPEAPGESGGPTIAYEAVREGIDDYRYLLTFQQMVEDAQKSGRAEVRRIAAELWQPVEAKIAAASFEGCKGRAAQGNWTGKCEYLPDGNRGVRGDHKIPNNWTFEDYDVLRAEIARGIIRLGDALQ